VHQVGYLRRLYRNALSTEHKKGTPYVCLYVVFSAGRYEGELINILPSFNENLVYLNFRAMNAEVGCGLARP